MRSIGAEMSADLLEVDGRDARRVVGDAVQPGAEPEVPDPAAVVAARPKGHRAAHDAAVGRRHGPARGRAENADPATGINTRQMDKPESA